MMERTTEQFIGIFPNAIHDDLCAEIVRWFDEMSKHGLTMYAMEQVTLGGINRKDEEMGIPTHLPFECFHENITQAVWQSLRECHDLYAGDFAIEQTMSSHSFKIHRVHPSEGYHVWHHEHSYHCPYKVLAWMIVLEAPKRGGETEFLYQSMRVEPKVGQLTIWPAAFTHKHRGNPPLEGRKTYITGWFELLPPNNNE
jgi:hypothetical protein